MKNDIIQDILNALILAQATIARLDAKAKAPSAQGTMDVLNHAISLLEALK